MEKLEEETHSINYQLNSIHFIAASTGNAKPNGQYELHTHYNNMELYYFRTGDLFFSFEGQSIPVCEGDMILVSNGTMHKPVLRRHCDYVRTRVLFGNDIFKQVSSTGLELHWTISKRKMIVCGKELVSSFRLDSRLDDVEKFCSRQDDYSEFCATIELMSILILMAEYGKTIPGDRQTIVSPKIKSITKYIDSHLGENLSYAVIAKQFYLSEKNLYRIFKKETGFTMSDYINERRILVAQSLLSSGRSAGDTAMAVGYQDYSIFYRNFLKRTGVAPAEFVKKCSRE